MALSVAAASVLFLAIAFINLAGNTASGPSSEQIALLEMWQQPYHTTTMLWNAASDDSGSDMSDQSGSAFTQDLSDSSESDEKYSTSNYDSGSHDSDDDSLKQILPSSVLGGDGQAVHTHQWDTSKLSNNDHWDSHGSDNSWSGDHDSIADKSWLSTDVKTHSWDSPQNSQLKQELKKMYNKGINAIPKSVAKEAAQDADQSFFKKWAKVGKKISKGKTGLSDKQVKLYKEAEQSVERDEKKKEKFVKAVHKKLTKATAAAAAAAAAAAKGTDAVKHALKVKDKLKAADRLAAKLTSTRHHAAHKAAAAKAAAKPAAAKEPAADPGLVGDRAAVHAIAQTKNPTRMEAKMSRLRQKIEADFDKVTKFAHAVKKSLPPLKAAQM
jgi:pyruvate/2-oxoglutarate dehydrogenase complex dihydrolipoamide acyltransferase (E2) component